jgi:hypothetical protein
MGKSEAGGELVQVRPPSSCLAPFLVFLGFWGGRVKSESQEWEGIDPRHLL